MSHHRTTPLGAIGRGLLAGVAGTAAMTACRTAVMKIQDAHPSTVRGQIAQRVAEGVFDRRVPDDRLGVLTQVVHWSYGTG